MSPSMPPAEGVRPPWCWVLLVFQDIEGRHPHMPWKMDELDRVMDGLANLADALTSCAG